MTLKQPQFDKLVANALKVGRDAKQGRTKQAKARKLGEATFYKVAVIGVAWEGFTGTYEYTYDHEPTEQFITARAGDFQSITDYEVTRVRRISYTDGDRRILKVVRPWKSQESIDIYCDANGC